MPDVSGGGDQWSLLMPVKRLLLAKTRLALAADARADVALAMTCDTATAALACAAVGEVVVITDDPLATDRLARLGARVVPDEPDAGLNPALSYGAQHARLSLVAAISSDLPALRSQDLAEVLGRATAHVQAVVSDTSGVGTTLLAARGVDHFRPTFGVGSFAAHVANGAVDLTAGVGQSLRQDVDDLDALHAAIGLGVGPWTSRALAGHGLLPT
jgi:2-phospho-L-lactate/phosphoenolpyruvate guanylyltransferase